MKTRTVILLSGYLGSGKDTVGAYLARYGFRRHAFADALKDEVAHAYTLDRADMDTQSGKQKLIRNGLTVRNLLISHGQMRREEDINYWVGKIARNIAASTDDRVVITDWRFPNEYDYLFRCLDRDWNIVAVRVNRWDTPPLIDESELALDNFPFNHVIDNASSAESLPERIDHFVWGVNSIRWLVVDVDDVLLDWIGGFRHYLAEMGAETKGPLPSSWDLREWITTNARDEADVNVEVDVEKLIIGFNSSHNFAALPAINGAHDFLIEAKCLGFATVAVTTCSDDVEIAKNRMKNLALCFPSLIARTICLPLHASKKSVYTCFNKAVVVDDKVCHVLAAAEAGLSAILFKRTWVEDDTLPDTLDKVVDHRELIVHIHDVMAQDTRHVFKDLVGVN